MSTTCQWPLKPAVDNDCYPDRRLTCGNIPVPALVAGRQRFVNAELKTLNRTVYLAIMLWTGYSGLYHTVSGTNR
jgi:hypothetical protein